MVSHSSQDTPKPQAPHEYLYQKGVLIAERYEVIEPLGFGGFSEVYHCRDVRLRRDVAVKVVLRGETALTEARAAAQLIYPHIVQVYEVGQDEAGHPVIVFQYIQGQTLEASLFEAPHHRLPLNPDTLKIVEQLADAIDHAHAHDVIHRDIKPSNIIIDRRGNAYLTDFGLAEVKMPEEPKSMLTADMQYRFGGTLPYMSPEQIVQGQQGDAHSDLYSLGIVVYEMLTGRFPYTGRETQLVFNIGAAQPEPPSQTNPDLPESIDPVMLQVLNKKPEERHESCQAFASALTEATRAYVNAEAKYLLAQQALDAKNWSQALIAFAALQQLAPGFKDVDDKVKEARQQVQLLGKREQAQMQAKQGNCAEAFATLAAIRQLDAEYDVSTVLDVLYQQAVQQYNDQKYEDCVRTLMTIRSHQEDYVDTENIEAPALAGAEKQRQQRELYQRGVAQMKAEAWDQAVVTFEELSSQAPQYEDTEFRLSTARHFAELSTYLATARAQFADKQYAACFDSLQELQRLNKTFKPNEVAQLRTTALTTLHDHAVKVLKDQQFEDCLKALNELEQRTQAYPDIADLRQQANDGIRNRALFVELTALYAQARDFESQQQYSAALERWGEIQQKRGDLEFPDTFNVESHAKAGLCGELYEQATYALGQQNPEEALAYWDRILEIHARYPDRRHLVQQAKDMQSAQAERQAQEEAQALVLKERRRKVFRSLLIGGGIVIVILLLIGVASSLPGVFVPATIATQTPQPAVSATLVPVTTTRAVNPPPIPSATINPTGTSQPPATDLPTNTPLPANTPTPEQATATPTLTPTNISSATPPPTSTPLRVPTSNTALALESSTIFAGANASAASLGFVDAGTQVDLLGRSAVGQWLCIRAPQGTTGYVSAPRFSVSGDFAAVPAVNCPVTGGESAPAATPAPSSPGTPLSMDIWDLPGTARCEGGKWYKTIYMRGQGGDGRYTYYWDGAKLAGPISDSYTFEVSSFGGALIKQARIVSGDGQQVQKNFYVPGANCS
jgi:tRNA A-37 threonylcarbamoyl transferase component Bud32